jgi:hypothetical protein
MGQLPVDVSALSEARFHAEAKLGEALCARSIKPLERSRPWLRRTRALWKFNVGKMRGRGAPRLCGGVQKTTPCIREPIAGQDCRYRRVWRSGKKRLLRRPDAEARSVAQHATYSDRGQRFHAAAGTSVGGERSRIWAAVIVSMTTIGPPHWGHSHRGLDCWAVDASGCGCCTAPSH